MRVVLTLGLIAILACSVSAAEPTTSGRNPEWTAPQHFRVVLAVDARGRKRSHSPAGVEIDFPSLLGKGQAFDQESVEVVALDDLGRPRSFDGARQGAERYHVPHRLDRLYGTSTARLHFVLPDHHCTRLAVYFDTVEAKLGQPRRPPGIIGDGDLFRQQHERREINASHFDQFVDLDRDGDLDLFKGGVEPYVTCFENVGESRLAPRGRLASGGKLFTLPCSQAHRSWVTVAFYDVDGDGDLDFLPSFGDGPDVGKIVLYRNTTKPGSDLAFERVGHLRTEAGEPLAGGKQAGGWFPSITFVKNWDGDGAGRLDALVGSNHRCWLYRGLATHTDGSPRFASPIALQAAGQDIALVNPRFEVVDIDADGDLDLFAGAQPGPIWFFENEGPRAKPVLKAGVVVALDGKFLIGDAHSSVKVSDFDGDGLFDMVAGRFWERTDLNHSDRPRDFGGFFRNAGTRAAPRFERTTMRAPATEQFQICDAVRQNCVRSIDWNSDGKLDLLAGDTDGFLWLFRNSSSPLFPLFAGGEKVLAKGTPLSLAASGGHARFDACDWDKDGDLDLLVADGQGTLTLYMNQGTANEPVFDAAQRVLAGDKPIQVGARASVLMCDWDQDGKQDVVLADDKGYYWHRNVGEDAKPVLAPSAAITFAGKTVSYVRPNLGAFVDWDGDGRRDFIGCHFENSIRLYRNIGAGKPGAEPRFENAEGVVILEGSSPQMISGAHAVDFNGDGDLDLITGQGHGGSGLRYYERDWLEDERHGTHPRVAVGQIEKK